MKFFEKKLLNFYKRFGRSNLPWRKNGITPYEVWVSEIMLQQTQVARVIDYYTRFLKKFPTIRSLAKSSWEEFLPYYTGLGYYRRGHNMLKTAKIIVEKYKGVFPQDKKSLMALPGIGEYTTSAILSFAFNKNYLAYDTNARRVFGRFLYGDKNAQCDRQNIGRALSSDKKNLNAAIMDFANAVCRKTPRCEVCPLSEQCRYFRENGKKEMRILVKKSIFPTKNAQVFLWLHKDHQEYYSPNPDVFEVFVLLPATNTREGIKKYFKKNYGIDLSVRPPHKKVFIRGVPTIFVNAQILLGQHEFGIFSKKEASSIRF